MYLKTLYHLQKTTHFLHFQITTPSQGNVSSLGRPLIFYSRIVIIYYVENGRELIFEALCPNCLSFKNKVFLPSSTLMYMCSENIFHTFLTFSQFPAPYECLDVIVIQEFSILYFSLIICLHSLQNLHNHFIRRLLLCTLRFLTPKPPSFLPMSHSHLTRSKDFLSLFHCHKKSLLKLSILFSTLFGRGKSNIV